MNTATGFNDHKFIGFFMPLSFIFHDTVMHESDPVGNLLSIRSCVSTVTYLGPVRFADSVCPREVSEQRPDGIGSGRGDGLSREDGHRSASAGFHDPRRQDASKDRV